MFFSYVDESVQFIFHVTTQFTRSPQPLTKHTQISYLPYEFTYEADVITNW